MSFMGLGHNDLAVVLAFGALIAVIVTVDRRSTTKERRIKRAIAEQERLHKRNVQYVVDYRCPTCQRNFLRLHGKGA